MFFYVFLLVLLLVKRVNVSYVQNLPGTWVRRVRMILRQNDEKKREKTRKKNEKKTHTTKTRF